MFGPVGFQGFTISDPPPMPGGGEIDGGGGRNAFRITPMAPQLARRSLPPAVVGGAAPARCRWRRRQHDPAVGEVGLPPIRGRHCPLQRA